jgi:hypothetical protein
MKVFRFRLERVRQWREVEHRLAAARVEAAQSALTRASGEQATIQAALDRGPEIDPETEGMDLGNWSRWKIALERHLQLALQRVETARTVLREQQGRLIEAGQKVQLLHKLHDNKLDLWKLGLERESSALATELHLSALSRNLRATQTNHQQATIK